MKHCCYFDAQVTLLTSEADPQIPILSDRRTLLSAQQCLLFPLTQSLNWVRSYCLIFDKFKIRDVELCLAKVIQHER